MTPENRRSAPVPALTAMFSAILVFGGTTFAVAQSTSRSDTASAKERRAPVFLLRGTTGAGAGMSPTQLLTMSPSGNAKSEEDAGKNPAALAYPSAAGVFGSAPQSSSPQPSPASASTGTGVTGDETEEDGTDAGNASAEPGLGTMAEGPTVDDVTTGRVPSIDSLDATARQEQDQLEGYGIQNGRATSLDGLKPVRPAGPELPPGIRIGTLTLRPTLSEKIVHESIREATGSTSRVYSETAFGGTLTSDWSRHALTVTGSGIWQENLSGTGTELPSASFDAELRVDLIRDTEALFSTSYDYSQESVSDPNAISGATAQSGIHVLSGSASVSRSAGILRGTAGLALTRTVYGDATLSDGSSVSGNDRDTLALKATTRIGYALSPALIPFLEMSVERTNYDRSIDSTGVARASTSYAAKVGATVDLGEKWSGELSGGYVYRDLDDPSLGDFGGFTIDGKLNWSPLRGTIVSAGLATTVEASTGAGQSGSIVYAFTGGVTQDIGTDFEARFATKASYRDYAPGSINANQYAYGARAGIDWRLNSWMSLDAEASYERTVEPLRQDTETIRAAVGLKIRR